MTYQTYTNVRFGYRVDYPVPELLPQPEALNGDGRVFRSADGQAEMRLWGLSSARLSAHFNPGVCF